MKIPFGLHTLINIDHPPYRQDVQRLMVAVLVVFSGKILYMSVCVYKIVVTYRRRLDIACSSHIYIVPAAMVQLVPADTATAVPFF